MRLEDYWGIGPKTAATLREALGEERAVAAIESADVRALVDAGVTRGRATRVLRRANGGGGMDLFATKDAREVYDRLLSLAAEFAVTDHAADRVRVLTPLPDEAERAARLDDVLEARDAWAGLDDDARAAVLAAFDRYDEAGGTDRAAVETALALRAAGLRGGTFAALDGVDEDALAGAADALGALTDEGVAAGADEELDRLRERRDAVEALADSAFDVIDTVRERGVRDADAFESAVVEYVADETDLTRGRVRSASPDGAVDSADFVSGTLRELSSALDADVTEREETVRAELEAAVEAAGDDVERAVEAAGDIAFLLSLARFAVEYDLTRPDPADDGIAVREARNLFVDGEVQPVTYAVGAHPLGDAAPSDDRVAVLTGANSGGKTTLLETLAAVVVLASMGLPVPAEEAAVGGFDAVVFHRRHASFNAGVLESTLKSIVPPLSGEGRTLMLVDEFEAITEPGRAADLLNGLVELTVERGALGVYVTHLADDLSPLPDAARIDGIFAEGLTEGLELEVDYQPRFGTVGRSTPEFIVSRLVANAGDRAERAGFERLAAAVGEEAVQRTLSDVEWTEE
ncbi:DNA mismatch repair protein, muts family [Candidatus Halobonum tyrrellensis]|uniref:DNA mismatch repair protein, muts family n=1 Tax=Candidatus Halobonum tyrrellensis G22 TaxID=1324957 RepID=V4HJI9_9EURY|nr:DNA mismatch repair protein, muts family [Candidatus Halobonum tyrrellensis]ESP88084.1 DNA mismatch repair protein, muts family [Candidatus Halobonum tyrrellensis G22]